MNKLTITALLASVLLTGCFDYGEHTSNYKMPDGLKDCKVYRVEGKTADLTVIRCPLSSTTVKYGKNRSTTVAEI